MTTERFFEVFRERMVRNGDWTAGVELNTLDSSEWKRPFRVLVTRLSTYEDTALSISHHYLYALLAAQGYYVDRAFLPPLRDVSLWEDHRIPWLTGVQSRKSFHEFDVIALSNSVAQEMMNVLWFLKNSGVPLSAAHRRHDESIPLIVLGGANAPYSSLFWTEESPIDLIYVGEDRSSMETLFHILADGRAQGATKEALIQSVQNIPGVLIPGGNRTVKIPLGKGTLDADLLAQMPVSLGEGNAGKATVALSEGCAGFCSFCAESWTRKPYRQGTSDAIVAGSRLVKAGQGASRLDFFSFNFNMHDELYPILESVLSLFSGIGLKSQRFDSVAHDPQLIVVEKMLGKTWFTCGWEGISERTRRYLNKNLTSDQIFRAMGAFVQAGVRELKAFLIATGREEDPDFEEFSRNLGTLRSQVGPSGRSLKIVFSVTPLVHFPYTPLEFEPPCESALVDQIIRRIVKIAADHGFEARAASSADEAQICDWILRPLDSVWYQTWARTVLETQIVYRDFIPASFLRRWQERLDEAGWPRKRVVEHYEDSQPQNPWSGSLELPIGRRFLLSQHKRNRSYQELEPAGLVRSQTANPIFVRQLAESLKAHRSSEVVLWFVLDLADRAAYVGRDHLAAALARALMLADTDLVSLYRGFETSHWIDGRQMFCPLVGTEVLGLRWLPSASSGLAQKSAAYWANVNENFGSFGRVIPGVHQEEPNLGPWTIAVTSELNLDSNRLLTSRGLKHTLRKTSAGHWVYDLPAATLKKGWFTSLESDQGPAGWSHIMGIGEKWNWQTVAAEGFPASPHRNVRSPKWTARAELLPPR